MDYVRGFSEQQMRQMNQPEAAEKARKIRIAVGTALFLLGLVFCFFGQDVFKPSLFVIGFTIAGGVTMVSGIVRVPMGTLKYWLADMAR